MTARPFWKADYFGMLVVLIALCAYFALRTGSFFTPATFITIANQNADAIVLAVGMTFVLIIAGIDLSIGSVLALSSAVLCACLVNLNWPLPLAIAACVATGLLCGMLNGVIVIMWNIPSFIVTLGMLEIARGAAFIVTNSRTIYVGSEIEQLAEVEIGGLSLLFFLAILIVLIGHIVLRGTPYGRRMLAVGANEDTARLSGVNTKLISFSVFAISGLCAGIAGVIYSARLSSAIPDAAEGYELQAIAAVVIGGTSLMGGRGSVLNSFFGVLIIGILAYGLSQLGAQEPTKRVVTGVVIVLAVIADYYRTRLNRASA